MNAAPRTTTPMRAPVFFLGWAVFACAYFLLAFSPGVIRSDDFGYLRSILGTLARGRPYVYEWLEPYGATFSSISALLYTVTGSFTASTWGFQAACVLALYPLLYRLVSARCSPDRAGHAALATLALTTFPIFFAKEADFHTAVCTLDLFLASLILYESKGGTLGEANRLPWFFLTAFLAFANRQNHICLLVLPAWSALQTIRARRIPAVPIIGAILFAAAAAVLILAMNRTYASRNAGFLHADPMHLLANGALSLAAGGLMTLGCLGVFSALVGNPAGRGPGSEPGQGPAQGPGWVLLSRRWLMPLAASLGLLAMVPLWHGSLLHTDTPLFGFIGWVQVNRALPWLLLPALWALDYRLLRPSPYLALAAGYIAIASIRGTWWDYYFLEISILCLLLALDGRRGAARVRSGGIGKAESGGTEKADDATWETGKGRPLDVTQDALRSVRGRGLPKSAVLVLAAVILGNFAYGYLLRIQSDKQALAVRSFERLERSGRVSERAMTGATFGYLGWKLFDWFTGNEGRTFGELADFLGYVRRDRVVIETGVPWRKGFKSGLPEGAVLLDSGFCRIGFRQVRYRIADLRGEDSSLPIMGRHMILDTLRYLAPRYPLNDREWRGLIEGTLPERP